MKINKIGILATAASVLLGSLIVMAQTDLLVYKDGKIIFSGNSADVNDISAQSGKVTITDANRNLLLDAAEADSIQLPIFFDDFSWVPSDGCSVIGWDTSGESNNRIDKQKATYDAHGWSSRSETGVYGRPGFVKLGRTSFGGDFVSPNFENLGNKVATVRVEFQAVGYATEAGNHDMGRLYVGVIGDGTVMNASGAGVEGTIGSIAYVDASGSPIAMGTMANILIPENGYFSKVDGMTNEEACMQLWDNDVTRYVVNIKNVTKDSRLVFIAGAFGDKLGKNNKNRIFLDNIKVVEIKSERGLATVSGKVSCAGIGVENVAVSDGINVTTTNEHGEYSLLTKKENGYVFISTPGGYEVEQQGAGNQPSFFKRLQLGALEDETADFSLVYSNNDNHVMLTLADMHLASRNNDVSQFESGFISDANNLIAQYTAAGTKVYALTLGDQSWDLYWYANNFALDDAAQKISKLNCPVYHIMGNHDNDPYVAADFGASKAFRNFIGPTYYSFNLGKVHYVVLDDIQYINAGGSYGKIGERNYNRMITAEQMEWLRRDLATLADKNTPIVVAMHAPLHFVLHTVTEGNVASSFGINNGEALEKVFSAFPNVTFVSGHTHVNCTMDSKTASQIREFNTGAICATWWWTGKNGYAGNHICVDGSPGGYGVWSMSGTDADYHYKSIGYNLDYQFRVYDLNQVVIDSRWVDGAKEEYKNKVSDYADVYGTAGTDNEILINCWGWGPGWNISVKENGVSLSVEHVSAKDPLHIISYECQRLKHNANPSSGFVTDNHSHFFKAKAASATSSVVVTVTDSWGHEFTQTITRPKGFGYKMN